MRSFTLRPLLPPRSAINPPPGPAKENSMPQVSVLVTHRKALWERQGKKYSTHPKPGRNSGFARQISEDRASHKLLRTPKVLPQVLPICCPFCQKTAVISSRQISQKVQM